VLGVPRKLAKYLLVLKEKLKKRSFSSYKLPNQQLTSFWFQGILGVNKWE
jgi:hypothetical protein